MSIGNLAGIAWGGGIGKPESEQEALMYNASSLCGFGDPSITRRCISEPTSRWRRLVLGSYLRFYNSRRNSRRPHSSLDRLTPDQAYFNRLSQIAAACTRQAFHLSNQKRCSNKPSQICIAPQKLTIVMALSDGLPRFETLRQGRMPKDDVRKALPIFGEIQQG